MSENEMCDSGQSLLSCASVLAPQKSRSGTEYESVSIAPSQFEQSMAFMSMTLYIMPGNELQQNSCQSYAIHDKNYVTWTEFLLLLKRILQMCESRFVLLTNIIYSTKTFLETK